MAHTTNIYYRDRLGFEPEYESQLQNSQQNTTVTKSTLYTSSGTTRSYSSKSAAAYTSSSSTAAVEQQQHHHQSSSNVSHGVYEENLTKFKGAASSKMCNEFLIDIFLKKRNIKSNENDDILLKKSWA